MKYFALIQESAEKFGLDNQEARRLHSALCQSTEPGAQFAARLALDLVKLTAEADNLMRQLASLAQDEEKGS